MTDMGRTAPFEDHPCSCVSRHSPRVHRVFIHHVWPLGMGGPDTPANRVPLCPTTHSEVHLILERWTRLGRALPRGRRDSPYGYSVARRGWDAARAGGSPT